jgi:glycosyltransferase involved in cell wall biosynthesis
LLFSIIMPVYNNERYFPLAVQSILDQSYSDFELIIVDDGSTDRTSELADNMAAGDKRIHVIHQKNQWIYASFNNGIKEAHGDYIYIVNSDDKLMADVLALMARKIREYDYPDVIWTKVLSHLCDSEQTIIEYDKYKMNERVVKELYCKNCEEVHQVWPFLISSALVYNQANLYRRELMQSQLFSNDVYGADVLYNIDIADRVHTALILPDPVYSHFVYENSFMNVSVGKYYPYEHDMFNDIYIQYKLLFQKWKLNPRVYIDILCKKRMTGLSSELRNLCADNCPMSLEEKIQFAFCGCLDEIIKTCVAEGNRQEELESRILCAVRELFIAEPINKDNKMYFAYELLESLLRYEKDNEDLKKIENGINHPLNPQHIGSSFYKKLIHNQKIEGSGEVDAKYV